MKMRDIYMKAIETGIRIDWRGKDAVEKVLRQAKAEEGTPGFDRDRLFNPYSNDNYGINRMLDALQESGPLTIYDAHNFVRVERRGTFQ